MAGKTKDMSQIKQLLLLKKEGVSNRKAAEIVGINKETASDYGFLLFVPSQRTEDFVYAITQCLKHLGGVPRMLVPDNL